MYPSRQRFTSPPAPPKTKATALVDGKQLGKDYGLKGGDTLVFKDLGPQVPYAVVFLAEYAGPMRRTPFYFARSFVR